MKKRLPITDEERRRAEALIDRDFENIRIVLEHPEILDAFEDGGEYTGDELDKAVRRFLERPVIRGNVIEGDPRGMFIHSIPDASVSGNVIDGSVR